MLGRSGNGSSVRPNTDCGVWGDSTAGYGVFAASQDNDAIHCDCSAATHAAVVAVNHATGGTGIVAAASGNAGVFKGNVSVSGDISVSGDVLLTGGQDCAEQFDLKAFETADPGTVLVIDESGALRQSSTPYDRRVAGVVSGAGDYRPAIVLGQQASAEGCATIALVGKVFCKVDADAKAAGPATGRRWRFPGECLESTCAVTRRRFSSGCKTRPATAPAGSNRSRHGGDEMSEALRG